MPQSCILTCVTHYPPALFIVYELAGAENASFIIDVLKLNHTII